MQPQSDIHAALRRQTLAHAEPSIAEWIALAAEQRHCLIKRQPDNIRVRADQLDDEGSSDALRRVAAGLAAPFAGGEIGLDILFRQALETHPRFDEALAERFLRRQPRNRRVDTVITAGEKAQAL